MVLEHFSLSWKTLDFVVALPVPLSLYRPDTCDRYLLRFAPEPAQNHPDPWWKEAEGSSVASAALASLAP